MELQLELVTLRLKAKRISLEFTKKVKAFLAEKGFDPSTITIRAGDTVAWNVTDDRPHTVYSKNVLGSDILIKDMLYNYTFARQGIYSYNCGVHREDIGKVIVLPS